VRAINVRLLIIVLALGAVFIVGVYFLHDFQVRRNAFYYKDVAQRALALSQKAAEEKNTQQEIKELSRAIQNLGWYLRFEADDADAMEQFASLSTDLAYRTGEPRAFERAIARLEGVLRLDAKRHTLRRKLIDLLIFLHRFQDAKQHLELLDPGIGDRKADRAPSARPDRPELLKLYGQCQAGLGFYTDAKNSLQKAIELDPKQLEAYTFLAQVLRSRLASPDAADACMAKLVEANPDSPKARVLMGWYLKGTASTDPVRAAEANRRAMEEAKQALDLASKQPPEKLAAEDRGALREALRLAAQCALAEGQIDEARNYVDRGLALNPDDVAMYAMSADVELRSGKPEAALKRLEEGLKTVGKQVLLLEKMAQVHIDARQIDQAREIIDELKSANYPKHYLEYLEARIELVQGHWLSACRALEKVRGSLAGSPVLLKQVDTWIGECYGRMGEYDRQLQACRRALGGAPLYAPARMGVIEALRSLGRFDEALGEYNQLQRTQGISAGGAIQFARLVILNNLRLPPEERNWNAAEAILNLAEKELPDQVQTAILRAEIRTAQNDAVAAEQILEKALAAHPKEVELFIALAALAEHNQDWDKAERFLRQSRQVGGDSVPQRIAEAQYWMQRYGGNPAERPKVVEQLRALAENCDQFQDAACLTLWSVLLNAASQLDEAPLCKELCGKLAEKGANNADTWSRLFEQARKEGDDAAMGKALDEIERIAGRNALWYYGQAIRLMVRPLRDLGEEGLSTASKYLAEARKLRPNWSLVPLLEAKIFDQQGETGQALERYQEAIRLGARTPDAIQRTVQILFQQKQYDEADRLLRQLERWQAPFSPELNLAGAEAALRQQEFDRALDMARKAADQDARNYRTHLWLGQLLGILGRRKFAEAQMLMDQASGAKTPEETAAAEKESAAAAELLAEAERALRKAVEIEPNAPETWVALVQFLNAVRMEDKAKTVIEEIAVKLPENQALLVQAQCYDTIQRVSEAQAKYMAALAANPQDAATIRLLADFNYRTGKVTEAEDLLRKIVEKEVPSSESDRILARRQLAVLLFTRGGLENVQRGRTLIEQNMAGPKPAVEDRRLMARLEASHADPKRRAEAVRSIEALIQEQSAAPDDRFILAQLYLAIGSWMQANEQLRFLTVNYPEETRYLTFYIAALLQHGELYDAEKYLEQLEKIAPKDFSTFNLRAELLVAQNEWDKALALLDRFWQETSPAPGALAQFCNRLLSRGKADPRALEKLDGFLQGALERFHRPIPLLLTLADLRTQRGQYGDSDGAEALYREVLKKQGGNVVALNNLAVLLALQGQKLDEALTLVNQAIEQSAKSPALLDSRASVYLARGELQKAQADIDAALAIEETPVRLFHKARICQEAGQYNAALTAMRKALRSGKSGLTAQMLHPLEGVHFEKMRRLAQ